MAQGRVVGSESFNSAEQLGLIVQFQAGALAMVVTESPTMTATALVAQIVALLSGSVTFFTVLLTMIDKWPRCRPVKAADAKLAELFNPSESADVEGAYVELRPSS